VLISSLNNLNGAMPLNGSGFNMGGLNNNNNSNQGGQLDLSSLSDEASGPDGQLNPAVLQMIYETRLQSDMQRVDAAKESGHQDEAAQAIKSLENTYGETKQKQVPINEELEKAVKQTLGIDGDKGNLDALDKGGFNADDGSTGGGGGGGGGGGCDCIGGGGGGGDAGPPPPLTEDDKKFLNQGLSQDSESFGDLVSGWRQGAEGNCATVAAIKASMDRYDNKVFDGVQRTEDGYNIVMQDGYKMKLSDQELAAAKNASNFKGADGPAKSYATFLYGAAAKRNALDNRMSLGQSFNDLNNGESIYSPAKLLGLQHQMVRVDPRTLNGQDSVVAGSHRHAIFVNKNANGGHTSDRWGRATRFNGTDNMGNGLINAYTFKPRSYGGGGGGLGTNRSMSLAGGPRSAAPSTRTTTRPTRTPVRTTTRRR
jgi:hypothetical protein